MIAPIKSPGKGRVKRSATKMPKRVTRAELLVGDARIDGKRFRGASPNRKRLKARRSTRQ